MLNYYAEVNGKRGKKFVAKYMDSIYNQYNKYCKKRLVNPNFIECEQVVGGGYWQNNNQKIILKQDITEQDIKILKNMLAKMYCHKTIKQMKIF